MKPKYLEFCGINSFSDVTVINFDKLLDYGLFGIFGNTGSGKSTILDCIVFALYGRISRAKDGAESINYNLDKAYVKFVFELTYAGARNSYSVYRELKRGSGLKKATLAQITDVGEIALASMVQDVNEKLLEIIGLSEAEFKKCIVLPQGEFAEFVKATRKDRIKLIETLFGLERYGERLGANLYKYKDALDKQYIALKTDIEHYAEVDEELVKAQELALADFESRKIALKAETDKLQLQSSKYAADLANLQLYEKYFKRYSVLLSVKAEKESARDKSLKFNSAKEVVNAAARLAALKAELDESVKGLQILDDSIKQAEEERDKLVNSEKIISTKEKFTRLSEFMAKEPYLCDEIKRLSAAKTELREVSGALDKLVKDSELLTASVAAQNVKLDNLNGKLGKLGDRLDIAQKIKSCGAGYYLGGELRSAIKYFESKQIELNDYSSSDKLYIRVRWELESKLDELRTRLSSLSDSFDADGLINEYLAAIDDRDKLKDVIAEAKREADKCILQLAANDERLKEKRLKSLELNAAICASDEKINKEFAELGVDAQGDYANTVLQIRERYAKYKSWVDEYNVRLDASQKRFNELTAKSGGLAAAISEMKKRLYQDEFAQKQRLSENGFASYEQAKALFDELKETATSREELDRYFAELASAKKMSDEYSAFADLRLNQDELNKINELIRLRQLELNGIIEQSAVGVSNLIKLRQRLVIKNELEQKMHLLKQKTDVADKLSALTRGNRFLEYVADEYLTDVSRAASGTLLDLTNGRYYLSYSDGFKVNDNYNAGKERGVNTLSGGETFLVSLSLALALSSAIFARSLRPMEFFFLDEGFGSLDSALVDTVVDSLEKLRSNSFSIGLISHVEELKNRIDCKIEVTGATESKGSSVKLYY